MEALGRVLNVVQVATGKHISLKGASGVTFLLYEDAGAQSTTFIESIAGASEQALEFLNHYYANNGVGSAWTRETADADATLDDDHTFVKKDTILFDCAAIYVGADMLSDGYDCIEATIDGAGLCTAIVHDLLQQRRPDNLPAAV